MVFSDRWFVNSPHLCENYDSLAKIGELDIVTHHHYIEYLIVNSLSENIANF